MTDRDAELFVNRKVSRVQLARKYQAENYILVGKSYVLNCLKFDSDECKLANKNIESLMELSENIKMSEVIQAPTIYPIQKGKAVQKL
ncbi:hypothetical protein [Alteromonas sp. ASW11-130]|uniref:hypothetical protein n=1 Tax=Alteromonas sp. ASW11-130 TaxID=3015775 RepID=UPI002241F316|nr:hypothetical protein [Alteromonas sp. ASW11-130]MCW8092791.1 hypothetical protein [Alteromonas sp. ASW11-130]